MPLLPATASLKATSGSGPNVVAKTLPRSKLREMTIDGPSGPMFHNLTVLSDEPVAMNPGMTGFRSKDETASSWAWSFHTDLLAEGSDDALRMS